MRVPEQECAVTHVVVDVLIAVHVPHLSARGALKEQWNGLLCPADLAVDAARDQRGCLVEELPAAVELHLSCSIMRARLRASGYTQDAAQCNRACSPTAISDAEWHRQVRMTRSALRRAAGLAAGAVAGRGSGLDPSNQAFTATAAITRMPAPTAQTEPGSPPERAIHILDYFCWWPGPGSNRRPSAFQADARTN
jgi:hypothetical protein